jgi:hypothetical protein
MLVKPCSSPSIRYMAVPRIVTMDAEGAEEDDDLVAAVGECPGQRA